jgi:hypothetical protein
LDLLVIGFLPQRFFSYLAAGFLKAVALSLQTSTGPEFHNVIWSDNQVDVSTSEISTIMLQGKGTRTVVRHGTSMTQNTLPFEKLTPSPWLRLTIVDETGKRAWTKPIWRT